MRECYNIWNILWQGPHIPDFCWNLGGGGGHMVKYRRLHLTMSCIRTASQSALSKENYVPKFGG